MSDKEFGKFIRGIRKQRGLTTSELAKKSGISQSYISQIETGNRPIPTDEVLLNLSQALKIDYAEMLDKAGRKTSAFDSHIRSFVHLLIGDREKDFYFPIKNAFERRVGNLFAKHDIVTSKKVTIGSGSEPMDQFDIANQYAEMILDNDNVQFKWDVLQELQDIAHEYHIRFNPAYEFETNQPRPIELAEVIENASIIYRGHPLTDDDKKLILDMLSRIYPDQK
ncbi:helix-turn-helix domain-containing protein [uncultured Brevibacillus sp.]|uniref:helix-turn-helix domain-containing protein n=1 Tax=uncultured Brevibacillus sp. TaxID=169970 RepID=UPI002593DF64|nr:helix-turn-helix transcriptional regulator [uncultured Brevibacillus sp.]